MPSGTKANPNVLFPQDVPGAHDVVDAFDLVIYVLNAALWRRQQCDFVMHSVDTQQSRVTDPVAHARAQHRGPEGFVTLRIGRTQSDVAKAGDSRIARGKIAAPTVMWRNNQVDEISARVGKGDEVGDAPLLGLGNAPLFDSDTCCFEHGCGVREFVRCADLKAADLVARIPFRVDKRMVSGIRAKIHTLTATACNLKAENFCRVTN